ncbi:S-protein homolog 5-like [Humulus lupulus]|uniref:S-protein homolog 5-like n=1 Tax=Humulus lupulus TaxID=3486 RepID=UPI002B40C962|nr:S-protein homolog 5-like [Humulus lupulus]
MVRNGRILGWWVAVLVCVCLWDEAIQAPTKMSSNSPWDRKFVRVVNKLDEGLSLTIHCKSKNDDLGVHVLGRDEYFEWTFYVNLWETTLFFCRFDWRDASKTFDAYRAIRDIHRCNHCLWEAKPDAIYGSTESGHRPIVIGW